MTQRVLKRASDIAAAGILVLLRCTSDPGLSESPRSVRAVSATLRPYLMSMNDFAFERASWSPASAAPVDPSEATAAT